MKFFGILSIIMGAFLLITISVIFIKEKDEKKKLLKDFIIYTVVGSILIVIGILSFFKLFNHWDIISTLILIVVLTLFLLYITITDKKGKKIVKYKTTGRGKNKKMIEKKENFEEK